MSGRMKAALFACLIGVGTVIGVIAAAGIVTLFDRIGEALP